MSTWFSATWFPDTQYPDSWFPSLSPSPSAATGSITELDNITTITVIEG